VKACGVALAVSGSICPLRCCWQSGALSRGVVQMLVSQAAGVSRRSRQSREQWS